MIKFQTNISKNIKYMFLSQNQSLTKKHINNITNSKSKCNHWVYINSHHNSNVRFLK